MFVRRLSAVLLTCAALTACGGEDAGSEDKPETSSSRYTKDNITRLMTDAMVEQGSMHVEMTMDGGPSVMTMSGDQRIGETAADTAMAVEYEMGEEAFSITLLDGIIFANLGEASDGKFVRIDLDNPVGPMGAAFAPMIDELDITTSIAQFEDAITAVERKGAIKTIDGVKTTPYRVTIDVDKAIASGAIDEDGGLRAGTSITYTFFIDKDDLLRRMSFEVSGARAQMDMSDFGEPVEIVEPSADQVVEESELGQAA